MLEEAFTDQTYYSVTVWVILGAIPVVYFGLALFWNQWVVPQFRQKGRNVGSWSQVFGAPLKFGLVEDNLMLYKRKVSDDPNADPNKRTPLEKFATLRSINWLLLIFSVILLFMKSDVAWAPAVLAFLIIWFRSAPILAKRKKTTKLMFDVVTTHLKYPRGSDLNPGQYVKVKTWQNNTEPKDIILHLPTSFNASSPMAGNSLEEHFSSTITNDNSWLFEWKPTEGQIIIKPVPHLPKMAHYPGSENHPWSFIPLGIGTEGEVGYDVTQAPQALIAGGTGSGKSVLQRNIVFHCIQHNDMWRFFGIDLKRVELTQYKQYTQTVLGIGANMEDGLEIVKYVYQMMMTRYEKMEANGVSNFKDLLDPETGRPDYAIMLMIDEAGEFMQPKGVKTDEGKLEDEMVGEAVSLVGSIARLGRAAGVHLVIATQRPDATIIKGELKSNLSVRVAAGRMQSIPSSMVLDHAGAMRLPPIKGRGLIQIHGQDHIAQGYYADPDWIDKWLKEHPGVEPALYPALSPAERAANDRESDVDSAADHNFEDGVVGGDIDTVDADEIAELEAIATRVAENESTPAVENWESYEIPATATATPTTPEPVAAQPAEEEEFTLMAPQTVRNIRAGEPALPVKEEPAAEPAPVLTEDQEEEAELLAFLESQGISLASDDEDETQAPAPSAPASPPAPEPASQPRTAPQKAEPSRAMPKSVPSLPAALPTPRLAPPQAPATNSGRPLVPPPLPKLPPRPGR